MRERQIESRRLATDEAILESIKAIAPAKMLDLGCGEGWLARSCAEAGISVLGVDAVPELIEKARDLGRCRFRVCVYDQIIAGQLRETFDLAACNFSLFGEQVVADLFGGMMHLLRPGGHLVVQTIHPVAANGDHRYTDGWRAGSWQGFSENFCDPAPWYFRTIGSWINLFATNGFRVVEMKEPVHPETGKPVSLVLIGQIMGTNPA